MIHETIRARAEARGAPAEMLDEYSACLDLCDRYRFAPVEVTTEEMTALLVRAERAMTEMERTFE